MQRGLSVARKEQKGEFSTWKLAISVYVPRTEYRFFRKRIYRVAYFTSRPACPANSIPEKNETKSCKNTTPYSVRVGNGLGIA